jgi:hypothetical protein
VFGLTLAMAQENAQEFFGGPVNPKDVLKGITPVFQWFMNGWAKCVELEKEHRIGEIIEIVSSMIHSTESPLPSTENDVKRLRELALQLHCRFPSIRGAFNQLLSSSPECARRTMFGWFKKRPTIDAGTKQGDEFQRHAPRCESGRLAPRALIDRLSDVCG